MDDIKEMENKIAYNKFNVIDMPKLQSPFKRVNNEQGRYVVTPEIDPDYAWVFTDPEVQAVEKLDGTNVSILINDAKVKRIFNRTAELDFFCGSPIIECLLHSAEKNYLPKEDGQWFGEAIGEKIQSNPLKIKQRLWIPFTRAIHTLSYHSWHKYPKTFDNISSWFKNYLFSLAHKKYAEKDTKIMAEGIVFTSPNKPFKMCKLRRNMFDWYT